MPRNGYPLYKVFFILLLIFIFVCFKGISIYHLFYSSPIGGHHSQKEKKIKKADTSINKKNIPIRPSQKKKPLNNQFSPIYCSVVINNYQRPNKIYLVLLSNKNKELWVSEEDLVSFHLKSIPNNAEKKYYLGKSYYNIDQFPNSRFLYQKTENTIYLTLPPKDFTTTVQNFDLFRGSYHPQKSDWATYLNYNVFSFRDNVTEEEAEQNQYNNIQFESVVLSPKGSLHNSFLFSQDNEQQGLIRLTSFWSLDLIEKMQTLQIGDALSFPAQWGSSIAFGGIQWRTNFSTQPFFNQRPLPAASGIAAQPSTAELYVNNIFNRQVQIPSGPFMLNNIPVINGAGNVNVVVKDAQGREYTIDVPYYGDNQLLKPGLSSFSIDIGSIRHDFGIDSNNYKDWIASYTLAHGFSDKFTSEAHTELTPDDQVLGNTFYYLLKKYLIVTLSLAASHQNNSMGYFLSASASHRSKTYDFTLTHSLSSSHFALASSVGETGNVPKNITSLSLSFPISHASVIGAGYNNQNFYQTNDLPAYNLQVFNIFGRAYFSADTSMEFTLAYQKGNTQGILANFSFTHKFGGYHHIYGSWTKSESDKQVLVKIYKPRSSSYGLDYSMSAAKGTNDSNSFVQGQASYRGSKGFLAGNILRDMTGYTNYQFDVIGSIVFAKGNFYLARSVVDNIAVINTPSLKNVPIYLENNFIGRTNRLGNLMVPDMVCFSKNKLSIHPDEIPLEINIDSTSVDFTPIRNGFQYIKFPIRKAQHGVVHATLLSGEVVPVGAVVHVNHQKEEMIVGYDGKIYLENLQATNNITIKWNGQACHFKLRYPKQTKSPLPDLGPVVCKPMSRST